MTPSPNPDDPRAVLRALEQRARRRFGQHFLTDRGVVDRIVRSSRITAGAKVVEIGPGIGMLTRSLVEAGADVLAVELDRDLAAYVAEVFPTVRVVEADAARVDWAALCPGAGHHVVANLPYNVGTTLTMQLVRMPGTFASITVMLQREVVNRLCAEPGSKTYGALSVEAQVRARVRFVLAVPPNRFHPPPKVDSAVVRLELFDAPEVGTVTPDQFDAVVRAAFSQRRKTAANALGARYGRDRARRVLEAAGVPPMARAEQLDAATFRALAAAFSAPDDGPDPGPGGDPGGDPESDRRYSSQEG